MTDANDNADFDALVSAIKALQERIERDGDTIRLDETRTRMMLIDPLLNALGWDTTDPAMVIPEYRIRDMRVDYALIKVPKGRRRAKPVAFVEAKRMVEYLHDHRQQVFNYAYAGGVKYGCLTNGVRWVLYDVFNKDAPRNDRRVVDVSLRHESSFDCAVKLSLLQAANLEHGRGLSIKGAQTLLSWAIGSKADPGVIDILLDRGASVAPKDSTDWTPLHHAAAFNPDLRIVDLLIKRGADTTAADSNGWTPLHHAVASMARCVTPRCGRLMHPTARVCKHCGMVQFMACVRCWRDTRLSNISRGGFCSVCAGRKGPELVSLIASLLDHDGNTKAINDFGETPLHTAATYNSNPEVVSLLIERGADVTATDNNGWTPLHCAAAENLAVIIRTLLDQDADVTAKDGSGWTPLHTAASFNSDHEVLALLVNYGADITAADDSGYTPLHCAARFNTESAITEFLLSQGANITATDKHGQTPLHEAALENPELAVTRTLLSHGADTTATNTSGRTPCQLAEELGASDEILQLLREHATLVPRRL